MHGRRRRKDLDLLIWTVDEWQVFNYLSDQRREWKKESSYSPWMECGYLSRNAIICFFDWSDNTKKISRTSVDVVLREKTTTTKKKETTSWSILGAWIKSRCCLLSLLSDFWRVSLTYVWVWFSFESELCSDKRNRERAREKKDL